MPSLRDLSPELPSYLAAAAAGEARGDAICRCNAGATVLPPLVLLHPWRTAETPFVAVRARAGEVVLPHCYFDCGGTMRRRLTTKSKGMTGVLCFRVEES